MERTIGATCPRTTVTVARARRRRPDSFFAAFLAGSHTAKFLVTHPKRCGHTSPKLVVTLHKLLVTLYFPVTHHIGGPDLPMPSHKNSNYSHSNNIGNSGNTKQQQQHLFHQAATQNAPAPTSVPAHRKSKAATTTAATEQRHMASNSMVHPSQRPIPTF